MSPYQHYMADGVQQYYYNQIKAPNPLENAVDSFWLNLIPEYFKKRLGYGIENGARPLPQVVTERANWTIRYVKSGSLTKVILMEDKRRGKESQPAEWRDALEQLTRYLKLVRTEPLQDPTETLYGSVNIGTYTRFYQLLPYEQECTNYPGTDGKVFEVAIDETEVHQILLELVHRTSH